MLRLHADKRESPAGSLLSTLLRDLVHCREDSRHADPGLQPANQQATIRGGQKGRAAACSDHIRADFLGHGGE